jgi:hypothetical protein
MKSSSTSTPAATRATPEASKPCWKTGRGLFRQDGRFDGGGPLPAQVVGSAAAPAQPRAIDQRAPTSTAVALTKAIRIGQQRHDRGLRDSTIPA